jgi:hypothetical protein
MGTTTELERRARQARAGAAVRTWEYRQRHLAGGVWFRLRRLLADARECWQIPATESAVLLAEGIRPAPVGSELEPPKQIYVISAERCERIPDRRQLVVGLDAQLLAARHLVLVPFD